MGRTHNNRVDNVLVMISPEPNQPLLYFADAVRVCLHVVAHIPIQLTALTFSCSETTNQAEKGLSVLYTQHFDSFTSAVCRCIVLHAEFLTGHSKRCPVDVSHKVNE